MINLLPPESKQEISFARKNVSLLKWIIALLSVISVIFIIVMVGVLYIDNQTTALNNQSLLAEQKLKEQNLEETKNKVQAVSGSVKLAVQVLSKQVLFSSMLKQIGSAVPEGAVLTSLSINQLKGGIDITAAAVDYDRATQVQVNLQDPNNKIFEKADIVNVQCSGGTTNTNPNTGQSTATQLDSQYPCKISLRALFAKENPFLFINKGGS